MRHESLGWKFSVVHNCQCNLPNNSVQMQFNKSKHIYHMYQRGILHFQLNFSLHSVGLFAGATPRYLMIFLWVNQSKVERICSETPYVACSNDWFHWLNHFESKHFSFNFCKATRIFVHIKFQTIEKHFDYILVVSPWFELNIALWQNFNMVNEIQDTGDPVFKLFGISWNLCLSKKEIHILYDVLIQVQDLFQDHSNNLKYYRFCGLIGTSIRDSL